MRAVNPNSRAAALYDMLAALMPLSEEDKLADVYRERLGTDAPWEESKHPRDETGKFSSTPGGGAAPSAGPSAGPQEAGGEREFAQRLNHYLEKKAIGGGEYRKQLARVIKAAKEADLPLQAAALARKMIESWTITAQNMARKGRLEDAQKIAAKIKKLGGPDIKLEGAERPPEKPAEPETRIPERKGPDTIASLSEEYVEFQKLNNLQLKSAEEESVNENLTREQRDWIRQFADRWNVAWEAEQLRRKKPPPPPPPPEQKKQKSLAEHKREFEEKRNKDREARLMPEIEKVAKKFNYPMKDIAIEHVDKEFELGGRKYKYAGAAYSGTGKIKIYSSQVQPWAVGKVLSHEIMHQKYNAFNGAVLRQQRDMMEEVRVTRQNFIKPDGTLEPAAAKKYPLVQLNAELKRDVDTYALSDGVTPYSRQYWDEYKKGDQKMRGNAFHETLAEMESVLHATGKLPGAPEWKRLYDAVDGHWREHGSSRGGFAYGLEVP